MSPSLRDVPSLEVDEGGNRDEEGRHQHHLQEVGGIEDTPERRVAPAGEVSPNS